MCMWLHFASYVLYTKFELKNTIATTVINNSYIKLYRGSSILILNWYF